MSKNLKSESLKCLKYINKKKGEISMDMNDGYKKRGIRTSRNSVVNGNRPINNNSNICKNDVNKKMACLRGKAKGISSGLRINYK